MNRFQYQMRHALGRFKSRNWPGLWLRLKWAFRALFRSETRQVRRANQRARLKRMPRWSYFCLKLFPLLLLMFFASPATAQRWDTTDKLLMGAEVASLVADCGTTIASLNRGSVERNPFLGQKPGVLGVVSMCVFSGVTTLLVADALPRKWRRPLLGALTVVLTITAIHNTKQGR